MSGPHLDCDGAAVSLVGRVRNAKRGKCMQVKERRWGARVSATEQVDGTRRVLRLKPLSKWRERTRVRELTFLNRK